LDGFELAGELLGDKIENIPLVFFESMERGDILFIDTSHIMKCQSDVEWELLHILPLLEPGVIVHIHDIFTPYEQPLSWLENCYAPGFYNEQYAFEALLSGGSRFKPLVPANLLYREYPDVLSEHFNVTADPGRSFWLFLQ
jgi:hypothetical protein